MNTTQPLAELQQILPGRLLTDKAEMAPFLTDWRGLWHGQARAVALPENTPQVAACLQWCARHGVPVVPQGGNTGLSGGATPDSSGNALLLSLKRMDKIRALDAANATLIAEAGCILAKVQAEAAAAGLLYPLSLAAEGSCTIGGTLATNAGGTNVLRYGTARALCLGLEVVTANGAVWDGLRRLRKDNTGYNLRDLIIGSEGTLGIITAAVLRLFPAPQARCCAMLALPSAEATLPILAAATRRFAGALSAAELIAQPCFALLQQTTPGWSAPFATPAPQAPQAPWFLLLEATAAADPAPLRAQMETLLATLLESGHLQDAVIAQSEAQAHALWSAREHISEAQAKAGPAIKHDIAVPVSAVPAFLHQAGQAVAARWPAWRQIVFGHLGDGNIHFNLSPSPGETPATFLAQQHAANELVHGITIAHGGSISAEHGLGILRHTEALRLRPAVETAMMRAIKHALDPNNILNPGKVLPAAGESKRKNLLFLKKKKQKDFYSAVAVLSVSWRSGSASSRK